MRSLQGVQPGEVQHKPGCTATEDGISYLGIQLIVLCSENKGADQLRGYRTADLRLYFSHIQKTDFLMRPLI